MRKSEIRLSITGFQSRLYNYPAQSEPMVFPGFNLISSPFPSRYFVTPHGSSLLHVTSMAFPLVIYVPVPPFTTSISRYSALSSYLFQEQYCTIMFFTASCSCVISSICGSPNWITQIRAARLIVRKTTDCCGNIRPVPHRRHFVPVPAFPVLSRCKLEKSVITVFVRCPVAADRLPLQPRLASNHALCGDGRSDVR